MSIAMMSQNEADLIIMCAAVCDHKPKKWGTKKEKKAFPASIEIKLSNIDILQELGKRKKENQNWLVLLLKQKIVSKMQKRN